MYPKLVVLHFGRLPTFLLTRREKKKKNYMTRFSEPAVRYNILWYKSPCLSRSMRFENSGNLGARAENTHVQIIFVATHSIQFQSHTYWPGYLNNLQCWHQLGNRSSRLKDVVGCGKHPILLQGSGRYVSTSYPNQLLVESCHPAWYIYL